MPKSLIATFGWTEQFVLSSILRYGLGKGDRVVLLIPDVRDERSEAVIRDFEAFLRRYGEGVELRVEVVPLDSFEGAVARVAELLSGLASEGECILNLSGGMRALVLAAYTAAALIGSARVKIELETEDRRRFYEIPNVSARGSAGLSELDRRILRRLASGEARSADLVRELGAPASTFHKRLRRLESLGLVELSRAGRALKIRATPLGKLIALVAKPS